MGRRAVDLTGQRFGAWTVLGRSYADYTSSSWNYTKGRLVSHSIPRWLCRCDCGAEDIVIGNNLKSGRSTCCYSCRNRKISEAQHRYHRTVRLALALFKEEYANG